MLKNKLLLLLVACSIYSHSFHINAMHNGQSNNIITVGADEPSLNIPEYKPFNPEFLYNKDFIKNEEALKNVKQKILPLLVQSKKQNKNYSEALPYLEEAIKHGDLQSMIWLGEYYEKNGDLLKAIQWYILVFQLHWLETFNHHPIIIQKFNTLKEKYITLTYRGKNKNNISIEFTDAFYNLSIDTAKKTDLKRILKSLASPKNNFLNFYPTNLHESQFDIYLTNTNNFIEKNQNIIESDYLIKLFDKIKQKFYQQKIKIYSKNTNSISSASINYISELHHILGLQYYCKNIVNIDESPNYTKAAEHFLLSQNADAHDILCDLYLNKDADFHSILNNPENHQSHEKTHNLINELSIQENIDNYYEGMNNKFKDSNNISTIVMILSLYHANKIGKKLNEHEKEKEILRLKNKALNILNQGINYNTNYFFRGYVYYFTNEYENARTNFLLALENKVNFDTSIIGLIDAHIQSEENLKNLEQEDNTIEDFSEYMPNQIDDLDTDEEPSTNLTEEEPSTEDLSSNIISESSQKTTITKELKQKLKIDRKKYKIQKDYENIKKHQKKFEEKQKKYGICLNENISEKEPKTRKIFFSSDNKPLTNKQKEIKQQYKLLITKNKKFQRLIEDVKTNPWSGGEGQVEHLKRRGSYSRRINNCDRLEYRVNTDGDIIILAVEGHYDS